MPRLGKGTPQGPGEQPHVWPRWGHAQPRSTGACGGCGGEESGAVCNAGYFHRYRGVYTGYYHHESTFLITRNGEHWGPEVVLFQGLTWRLRHHPRRVPGSSFVRTSLARTCGKGPLWCVQGASSKLEANQNLADVPWLSFLTHSCPAECHVTSSVPRAPEVSEPLVGRPHLIAIESPRCLQELRVSLSAGNWQKRAELEVSPKTSVASTHQLQK
jgi:hypothetical protein